MKNYIKIVLLIVLILLLTVLTQIGGLILLLCLPLFSVINQHIKNRFTRFLINLLAFIFIYLVVSFFIVPIMAKKFGRVPLPVQLSRMQPIRPLNIFTCLLNRHYVRPQLKETLIIIATQLNKSYPGSVVCYLDAGFPFMNGFPLIPHLSHHDGKKLDLAFIYKDSATGKYIPGKASTWLGYGICEKPQPGEVNMALLCEKEGYWQYSLLEKLTPQQSKQYIAFDQERTKTLIKLLAGNPSIGKIFLEPHLKTRMQLQGYTKIRFHGCQAVRHDDHIHVQLD